MSDTWKRYEGQVVNGKLPLLRYIGGTESSGVFLTERQEGERPARAVIKLIRGTGEKDELQLSRWRAAGELSHPQLILLYEMGRCEVGGISLLYLVMECAEENLAQVLPERALTPDEALAMLQSVVSVLTYLHSKGFVHGHIKPANIMAIGDQLKVSSDGIRRAGEMPDAPSRQDAYNPPEIASGTNATPQPISSADDVWSLGMTLIETLTQSLPLAQTTEQQDPLLPRTLPQPFLDIACNCLLRNPQTRWTATQIADRLEGRAPIPQVRTIPPKVRTPLPPPPSIAKSLRAPTKRRSHTVPITIGFLLAVGATLAGSRLLRRHSDSPGVPAAAVKQPPAPPIAKQKTSSPQEGANNGLRSSAAAEERSSKAPVPVPALIHPQAIPEDDANAVQRMPAGNQVRGEVSHKVMPEVLMSARESIRGTVRVRVKVNVDRDGDVEDAEVESRGPSKYFAQAALEAAQLWTFKPPLVRGRGVLSSWTLQFEFTRDDTKVVPIQELP